MNLILKIGLFIVILCLGQLQMAEILNERGSQLCFLRNLPHRGLGMLYYSYLMFPERSDYAKKYLAEYLMYKQEGLLSEPQLKPVIAIEAASMSARDGDDKALRVLALVAAMDARVQRMEAEKEAKANGR